MQKREKFDDFQYISEKLWVVMKNYSKVPKQPSPQRGPRPPKNAQETSPEKPREP
jgi:hypothetical protein